MRLMLRKFDEFNVYLKTVELNPYLFCITEDWISEQNSCEIFNFDG